MYMIPYHICYSISYIFLYPTYDVFGGPKPVGPDRGRCPYVSLGWHMILWMVLRNPESSPVENDVFSSHHRVDAPSFWWFIGFRWPIHSEFLQVWAWPCSALKVTGGWGTAMEVDWLCVSPFKIQKALHLDISRWNIWKYTYIYIHMYIHN